MLWAPQAECGLVHSNQEEQESGELWGCHWREACAVDPGVQHDCWSQGGVYLLQVFTGLASVSSRAYRLPAPQTDAEASTTCSSSGKLSTVLSMILPRTITMSQQLQRSGGLEGGSTMEKWWEIANYLKLKGSMETNCSRYHPSVLTKSLLLGIFPSTLNR